MANFEVRDAHGSIITIESSIVGGANRQVVTAAITTENSSVMLLNGANVIGSVTTLQGTNPWRILGSVSGIVDIGNIPQASVHGLVTVGSTISIGNTPSISGTVNIGIIPGSVIAFQGGAWTPSVSGTVGASIIGSVPVRGSTAADSGYSPGDRGNYILGVRNDTIASFVSANLDFTPIGLDSAGRILTTIAPEEARIEGYVSLTSTSVTTLVAAAGAGLRNYITDIWIANTGAAATLVTFSSGGGASVLGYTIAPAGSGSNLPGLTTPIRTLANETFGIQAATATSTLYATVKGFKAP